MDNAIPNLPNLTASPPNPTEPPEKKKRDFETVFLMIVIFILLIGVGIGIYLINRPQQVVPKAEWQKIETGLVVNCDNDRCKSQGGVPYNDNGTGGFFNRGNTTIDKWKCPYVSSDWKYTGSCQDQNPGANYRFQAAVIRFGCNSGISCSSAPTDECSKAQGIDKDSCEKINGIAKITEKKQGSLTFSVNFCGAQQLDFAPNAFNSVVDTRSSSCKAPVPPTPTNTSTPTPKPGVPTATPTTAPPTGTPTSTPPPGATSTPTSTSTPPPGATSTPTPAIIAQATATPTNTPTPTPTEIVVGQAQPTSTPTGTPPPAIPTTPAAGSSSGVWFMVLSGIIVVSIILVF